MRKLPIVHVHGQLGELKTKDGDDGRRFNDTLNAANVNTAARRIRIISEADIIGGPEYAEARRLLERAEVIVFLGFGYQRVNLERLQAHLWLPDCEIHGTVIGLVDREMHKASGFLRNGLRPGRCDQSIVSLFRERPIID